MRSVRFSASNWNVFFPFSELFQLLPRLYSCLPFYAFSSLSSCRRGNIFIYIAFECFTNSFRVYSMQNQCRTPPRPIRVRHFPSRPDRPQWLRVNGEAQWTQFVCALTTWYVHQVNEIKTLLLSAFNGPKVWSSFNSKMTDALRKISLHSNHSVAAIPLFPVSFSERACYSSPFGSLISDKRKNDLVFSGTPNGGSRAVVWEENL